MRKLLILLFIEFTSLTFSQPDSLLKGKKVNFGIQGGGQIATAFQQNWIQNNSINVNELLPYYFIGIYIKRNRHTFDVNIINNSFKSKSIIPFVNYSCKLNKKRSKIDINASARLYSCFFKSNGNGNIKYQTYSNNAFCYGLSLTKTYNRFTSSFAIYNYFTFESENTIYSNQKRSLPQLYGIWPSADFVLELKLMYRIN